MDQIFSLVTLFGPGIVYIDKIIYKLHDWNVSIVMDVNLSMMDHKCL